MSKQHYRIASVTTTGTSTILATLVDAVYTAKSKTPPPGRVFKVRLTPSAAIEVTDTTLLDALSISAMTEFEVIDALNVLKLKNVATVVVEIWYEE